MDKFLTNALRVALVGYGSAGRIFHAPLIAAVAGLQLDCICSRQAQAVLAEWPGVRVVEQAQQVFADPLIDVVVLATPNASHYPLALAALQAGWQACGGGQTLLRHAGTGRAFGAACRATKSGVDRLSKSAF